MATAVALIRVEKPHSLSYQESTRPSPPSTSWVCGRATVEDAATWLKSIETSGSLVTARMPFSGPLGAAASKAEFISSTVTLRLGTKLRATPEAVGGGTRGGEGSRLAFRGGITPPTALAGPAEVGVIDRRA